MKVNTCRICLAMGENMVLLGNPLKDYIEEIFKRNGFSLDLNVQNHTCMECKVLLTKSYNIIQRALRGQQALYNILKNEKVNVSSLEAVNRVQLGLNTNLSYYRVDIDFFIEESEKKLKSTIGPDINNASSSVYFFSTPDGKTEVDEAYENCYLDNHVEEETVTETDHKTNASTTLIQYKVKTECTNETSKKKVKGGLPPEIRTDNIILGCRRRNLQYAESDIDETEDPNYWTQNKKKKKRKRPEDEDYEPKDVSEESDSSDSDTSYNEFGMPIKKPNKDLLEYPRKCDHCNFMIEQAKMHFKHYLFCHTAEEYPYLREAKFVCFICGKAKRSLVSLRYHELTHGERTIPCTKCSAKFYNPIKLRSHMTRKHGSRQLICDYCKKVFKMKEDIILHIRTHTGEKPFKCHICGEGFAHLGNVGIHIRNRHQNSVVKPKKKKTSKKRKKVKSTTEEEDS